jgi:two-component system nitrogen regulation response regulator NtrX
LALDILIVDDEADIREILSDILVDAGYTARLASDGFEALDLIHARQPNLVILDVWLGNSERDGLKILDLIKSDYPYVPVVMISGHGTVEMAVSSIKKGAYDFVEKPFQTERLLFVIERALEAARLKRENCDLQIKAGISTPLIGSSPCINHLKAQVEKISQFNSRVFISSSPGFDQEALARDIHKKSTRHKNPFINVNIEALNPQYIESELFGLELSDNGKKTGLLERAHNGTLFIENLTHLTINVQTKLVKFLHEKKFYRVSGKNPVEVDVRFIAGAYESVETAIAEKRLREDLYYRLSVNHLQIPSLSERIGDIQILAEHYIEQASKTHNKPIRKLTQDVIALLQSYPWPGDLQQLKNIADYLVVMSRGNPRDPITKENLPPEIRAGNSFLNHWQKKTADIVVLPLREARDAFEREYILAQVKRFSGNISQTARFIGMERSALHRKMRALGLTGAG